MGWSEALLMVMEVYYRRRLILASGLSFQEWIMYKYIQILCISTVARLKCVYLKPFLPLLYSLLMLAE